MYLPECPDFFFHFQESKVFRQQLMNQCNPHMSGMVEVVLYHGHVMDSLVFKTAEGSRMISEV